MYNVLSDSETETWLSRVARRRAVLMQGKCEWREAPRVEVLTRKEVRATVRFTVP